MDDKLFVKDSRTSRNYEIPIRRNTISSASFKQIKVPEAGSNPADKVHDGLRLYDPGLEHTAISESKMTWM